MKAAGSPFNDASGRMEVGSGSPGASTVGRLLKGDASVEVVDSTVPVLFETFVESERHRGTCYKAADGIHVGQTVGRGKKCPVHQQIIPIKDIRLYPLRQDFARVLCR